MQWCRGYWVTCSSDGELLISDTEKEIQGAALDANFMLQTKKKILLLHVWVTRSRLGDLVLKWTNR